MLSAKLIIFATAGVSFLGYCIYFDRKRLADPDYKRKVHDRRQHKAKAQTSHEEVGSSQMGMGLLGGGVMPLLAAAGVGRKTTVQLHFESEFRLGEYLLINGHVDDGLTHLSNAILLCSKPGSLLLSIQKSLPEQLIHPLLMRVAELQKQTSLESLSESEDDQASGAQAKDANGDDYECTIDEDLTITKCPASHLPAPLPVV
ncbi:mitochondrial import receptor subunit TOM20 homolog B-like [Drosophila obscura]|uniref:mitochondrial import receptor subunit TOM20 homolog B-like n=1 Tax=Drosophila obscura TaxID=7282 RepID=UPI000B9FE73B|nr:mitochondrial import receptor subunit TOM20 homolog B-like [Drosophila obscura]